MTSYHKTVSRGPLPYWYMRIHVDFENDNKVSLDSLTFKTALMNAIKDIYGEIGAAITVDLLKFEEDRNSAILRVHHSSFIKLWTSMTLCTSINNRHCAFRVEQVSPYLMGLAANSRAWDST